MEVQNFIEWEAKIIDQLLFQCQLWLSSVVTSTEQSKIQVKNPCQCTHVIDFHWQCLSQTIDIYADLEKVVNHPQAENKEIYNVLKIA